MNNAPSSRQSGLWSNSTIGLLGGSFNPAHEGHRHISLYALKLLGLDAVWWMVSPQNPLKPIKGMASLEERMDSARKASHHPDIYVTDIERQMNTRYTADTLAALKNHFPRTNFIWLMGTDNLLQIHRWRQWEAIFNLVPVAVFDRPPRGNNIRSCPAHERFRTSLLPQDQAQLLKTSRPPAWSILHIPLNEQSATSIRERSPLRIQEIWSTLKT
jgi:nicotinate-nucleotide adenylyltransferase